MDHKDSLTEHKRTTLVPDDHCQVDSSVQVAFFFLVSEDFSGSAGSLQTGRWGVVGGGHLGFKRERHQVQCQHSTRPSS